MVSFWKIFFFYFLEKSKGFVKTTFFAEQTTTFLATHKDLKAQWQYIWLQTHETYSPPAVIFHNAYLQMY